jgi:Uncharacterised nucleotidyltransferase
MTDVTSTPTRGTAGPPSGDVMPEATPLAPSQEAEAFYAAVLQELARLGLPFLVGGTYALCAYTGIQRPTKDLDILCKAGDFPRILSHFQAHGAKVEIEDERWIGKIARDGCFFDLIFGSANGTMPVNDRWFEHAQRTEILGVSVLLASPTDMIWSKAFIQVRHRFDGPDIMHVILRQHARIDWQRLLTNMEPYWEVLLAHLVNFRWIYPSERDVVPRWLMEELLERLRSQLELPPAQRRICRGSLLSRFDYRVDAEQWGFGGLSEGET